MLIKPEWLKARRIETVETIVEEVDLLKKVNVRGHSRVA